MWYRRALCAKENPEIFYIPEDYNKAIAICNQCPVIEQCRQYADTMEISSSQHYIFGIWGGETPENRYIRRRAKFALSNSLLYLSHMALQL